MPGPQLEDGYFRVANEWWDALCRTRIPGEQVQIVHYVIRRTYGYREKEAMIKPAQFVFATGINKGNVYRALRALIDRRIIGVKKDTKGNRIYWFNKNYCQWKECQKGHRVSKRTPNGVKKDTTPIKTNLKNKKKKNMSGKPDGDGQRKVEKVKDDLANVIVRKTIEYLNEKTGKKFQYTSQSAQKFIRGRLSQGYTLEDFKKVIDVKTAQWLSDPKNNMYLRPETLFNETKFQTYVNLQVITEEDEISARAKRVFGSDG